MRLAITLGGTDRGRSGLGTYVRAVLPRLSARLRAAGGSLVAIGTARDLAAYNTELAGTERSAAPDLSDAPIVSAAWHLWGAGRHARQAGADVLLLPAANRRMTARAPLPTVAVVHDLAQLRVRAKYDPLRMAYTRRVILGSLRSAGQLVAVSGTTRDDLAAALGRSPGAVTVVPNGVDAERFTPPTADDPRVAEARRATGLAGPYVLYPSRLEHPGKNHLRLLQAFAGSPAAATHVLALAGGDWGAGAVLRAEIARLGIDRRVAVLGHVSDGVLPGLVAGADAVAMVGLWEGFGLPALEALAAGRPVVASRTGALPEVVGPLAALCDPYDLDSIAAALGQALGDTVFRQRAADEGPAWARGRSWDTTADGLLDACRKVILS